MTAVATPKPNRPLATREPGMMRCQQCGEKYPHTREYFEPNPSGSSKTRREVIGQVCRVCRQRNKLRTKLAESNFGPDGQVSDVAAEMTTARGIRYLLKHLIECDDPTKMPSLGEVYEQLNAAVGGPIGFSQKWLQLWHDPAATLAVRRDMLRMYLKLMEDAQDRGFTKKAAEEMTDEELEREAIRLTEEVKARETKNPNIRSIVSEAVK